MIENHMCLADAIHTIEKASRKAREYKCLWRDAYGKAGNE